MRQRASLCRALVHKPEVLILDEPFGALDAFTREDLWQVMHKLRQEEPFTGVLITHDLRVAAQVCDRLAVMRYGEIVETGATSEIFKNPQHSYTQDLLAAVPGKKWDRKIAG